MSLRWFAAVVALATVAAGVIAAPNPQAEGLTESLVETQPRQGVYQRSLLSRKTTAGEKWVVITFPGYPGILHLAEAQGEIGYELRGNFVVRARRHLVSDQIAVATLDCPSDEQTGCGDDYRASEKHLHDVDAQIDALRNVLGKDVRVALLGTSYGTLSTQLIALKMGSRVDAIVHSASITMPRKERGHVLEGIDLRKVAVRQLLVHHLDDPCDLTPFAPLKKYEGAIPLMLVKGLENPRGPACEAFTAHGFVGRERAVMVGIGEWILANRPTSTIE